MRGTARNAWFVARADVAFLLRARETLLWVFVMPVLFFFFIGNATKGFGPPDGERKDPLLVERGEDAGFLADEIERRLAEQDYAPVAPEALAEGGRVPSRRIAIPAAFTDSVLAGVRTPVVFEHSAEGLGSEYENVRVGRAVYTVLADLTVAREEGGAPPGPATFAALRERPRALTLEVRPAGKRREPPSGFEQAIPGIMVMFGLLVMTTSGAVLLVIERRQGLLRRLASAPIGRHALVLGKWGGKLALGLVQVAFAMAAGTVLFRMDWGPNLAAVVGLMVCYSAMMAAVGLLLGSVARSEAQAAAIGVVSSNVLAALGGCWWPIEITPEWMQRLQLALPTGWAMDALHRLVSFGAGPASALPHAAAMLVATAALLAVASRAFRWE